MLVTILVTLAALVVLAGALWLGLAFAMRRPAVARRLMRFPPTRLILSRAAAIGMRAARRRAERNGTIPAGRSVTDLEVALAASDSEQARRARAMLARMNPRQRNEFSRRALGADGLSGLLAGTGGADDADATEMLGRAGRRGTAFAGSAGRDTAREAQRRRAVAKRRAARKKARR